MCPLQLIHNSLGAVDSNGTASENQLQFWSQCRNVLFLEGGMTANRFAYFVKRTTLKGK